MGIVKSLMKCFHFIIYVLFLFLCLKIYLQIYLGIRTSIATPLSLIFALVSGFTFNYEMILDAFKKTGKWIVVVCIGLSVCIISFLLIFQYGISPNIPFDYMSNLNNKPYEILSTGEKKVVYSIPEKIAKKLKTNMLLETILKNKYLIDLYAYDDFVSAVKSREMQFRIVEFLSREDSVEVLDEYILKYEKNLKKKEIEINCTIEDLEENIEVSEISEEQGELLDIYRNIHFMELLKEFRIEILN